MSRLRTRRPASRPRPLKGGGVHRKRLALMAMLALLVVGGVSITFTLVASAAPQTVVDQGGEDDLTGQKDLNSLTVDYGSPGATTLSVSWNWDDTATTGANTRDACSLFDTDGDGFANFSFCLTVNNDTTVSTARLYACTADSRTDRCGSPSQDTTFDSTGTASVVANSDPFGGSPTHQDGNDCDANPLCNTADTVAETTVTLSDFGGGTATLLNVCSYPSQEPNSDPSDCVFIPNAGFIRIVKNATPDTTASFSFTLDGTAAFATNGDGTSQLLPVNSSTNHSVAETAAAGWQLSTASCLKADNTTTGTLSGTTISDIDPNPGEVVTCTFNNVPSTGTLTLVKQVDNLGESGPGYKGVGDFPLTIDGTSTTSGTPVTVTVGNHTIAESSQSGYTVGTWSCTDDTTGTAGSVSATVNVSSGENVTCTMTNTLIAAPGIQLVKSATPSFSTPPVAGDTIGYSFVITNTGNVTLTGVDLDDALVGFSDATCGAKTTLAPTESTNCTATYTLTQADVDAGSVANTATACGTPPTGPDVCDTDATTTPITRSPAIEIQKTPDTQLVAAGGTATFSITVTNTGNVTLTAVNVSDALAPDCDRADLGSLAPGASTTYACTKTTVTAAFTNTAIATGTKPGGGTVTDSDTAAVTVPTAQITPTATTCQAFRGGTAADLNELLYTLKDNAINSVAPGVLFYYSTVTVSADDTITVIQSDNGSTPPLGIQQEQAILWNLDCTKATNNATGTFTAPANGTYIIGIKYTPDAVKGSPDPGTVTYTFMTSVNGATVASSTDTIVLKKK
jgi:uncharacterized repeat protein (TIGR01451 family)